MTHKITDIADQEWGEGDYIYYGSDGGEITYARVERIEASWKQKFTGGYWDYTVWVIRLNSTRWFSTAGKPARLTKIRNIVKAPEGHTWNEDQ